MENFLHDSNRIFMIQDIKELLQNNQGLLMALEGDDGLLASLELATLSQQFYAQNIVKEVQKKAEYFLYCVFGFIVLEVFLLFWKPKS